MTEHPIDESWYPMPMTTIFRIFAWLLAAAVTFATLLWFRETYRSPFIRGSSGTAAAFA